METIERIEELKLEIEKQKKFIESENEKTEKVKTCCDRVARLLCTWSTRIAAEITQQNFEQMIELQPDEIEEQKIEALEKEVLELLQKQSEKMETLVFNKEIWPHMDCRMRVNLDERLRDAQFELKGIENKMLDGTRAQLRKRAMQMEEAKNLCTRMEQAVLSVESWEKLFLMFMEDMEIRRRSGMDDTFYLMEREDIRRKLQTCFEFSDVICQSLGEMLCSSIRDSVSCLGNCLIGHGFHFSRNRWNRTKTAAIYTGEIRLSDEITEEISRYAAGIMFIEKHLHNIELAEEKVNKYRAELARLTDQAKGTGKLVV
ncbi:hypothetical protein V3C10_11825 [[Clostridium] symbiosum]|uniref:hypothetical protein n=1 Tax=Clostridium symbiosum TaxID=1512 RepID=UPI001D05DEA7|nr:hypothetical protein [[Clostridium] symbiosum]MCB6609688.1 hypothetical protein [[Clostridium] symbiosum]MCB6931954.1 hypothetical protein [[Clostridium] symbiosum]